MTSEFPKGATPLPTQLEFDFESFRVPLRQLLNPDEIYERVDESLLRMLEEDNRIERKKSHFSGESLGAYFSMWANTCPGGGIIVSGQFDQKLGGGFEGCECLSPDELNRLEACGRTYCPDANYVSKRVSVTNVQGKPDFVVVFRVQYKEQNLVRTTAGKVFRRVADQCIEVKDSNEIRELQADKGEIRFEQQPSGLTWPDAFEQDSIAKFVAAVKLRRKLDENQTTAEVLTHRRLGTRSSKGVFIPNIACALLFAKDPQEIAPGCKIRFQRFEGEKEGTGATYNAVKDEIVEGNVPSLIVQVASILESQLRTFSPLDAKGKFYPVPEYPKLAWYEAVVNACVHRSYGNGMRNIPIFVKMFDDRLEIDSPGPFPPHVNPENIYTMHAPRNPQLMDAMFYMDHVKCANEGTRRIRDTMAGMSLPMPEFSQPARGYTIVKVILRNHIKQRRAWIDKDVSTIVTEAITAGLSEDEIRIINWAAEHRKVTISDTNRLLQLNWVQARGLLHELVQKRIFQYIRFRPLEKDVRDPEAYFRLRSSDPIPEGGFDQFLP
jgi:ATP-dependent DNA helicase RecG